MTKKSKFNSGFTLIEILIVVAIIAILASVVLVGLGPTQQSGRDARRISDLHEVQTGLELYYSKCGNYPGTSAVNGCPTTFTSVGYAGMSAALTGSNIGVSAVPNDPTAGRSYFYGTTSDGSSYILGTVLENKNNSVFVNYTAPLVSGYTGDTNLSCTTSTGNYCITL